MKQKNTPTMKHIIQLLVMLLLSVSTSYSQSTPVLTWPDQNYVLTISPTVARSFLGTVDADSCLRSVTYFDGLGRPIQKTEIKATPGKADLVTYQEYDIYGRESNAWLPRVTGTTNAGTFVPLNSFKGLSATIYQNDACTYSKAVYENSPLSRVREQYGPGYEWHSTSHAVKTAYLTNLASSDTLNCIYYKATVAANDTLVTLTHVERYDTLQLYVTWMMNEDGNTSLEFKNKLGQVILQRQLHREGKTHVKHDTYFIYDEYGNQTVVLPPAASDVFGATTGSWNSIANETLKKYAYLYKYDQRNRCVAKKLPDCGWIYYIYDQADRLIFSQDGEQRERKEWSFSLPDAFNRVCVTGVGKHTLNLSAAEPLPRVVTVTRDNATAKYKGYALANDFITNQTVLTVNYYDDYAFLNKTAISEFNNTNFAFVRETGFANQAPNAKTQLTGTLVAKLDGSATPTYLGSTLYYDYRKRMIQSISSNHFNGYDKEHILYDFTGNPTQRKHVHTAAGDTQTEVYKYTYDHAGRLKKTTHQLTVGTSVKPLTTLVENTYDELGRVVSSKSNNLDSLNKAYTYNVRSWIEKISNTHFTENLTYSKSGNIKTQQWIQASKTRNYTFAYDGLSRLKSATYIGDGSFGTSYVYDKQGNITALTRYGNTGTTTYGIIDNLTMGYAGNQLIKVEDSGVVPTLSSSADFRNNGVSLATEYYYDTNSNLTKDLNKGISNITYNSLNLPRTLVISNTLGQTTNTYVYSADGKKLSVSKGSFTTDYVGNMIYESGILKRILVDNGYYENGIYYFYINDHLGNNRIVANQSGTIVQSTQYYPFGMAFADGVDPSKQPYKYNGKELDGEKGLNWYDYSARQMEPALGRFLSIDPLAEKYYSVSPYVYCANNPVNYIDPDGKDWYWDKDKTRKFDLNITSQSQLEEGQIYIGTTDAVMDRNGNVIENYRDDGSIMFSKESSGYARMVSNSQKTKNEEMGIITDKGVLVLPSYKNTSGEVNLADYGYSVKNGNVIDAKGTVFNTVATAHTHPDGSRPSTYDFDNYGDLGFASFDTPYKPVYVLQMNKQESISLIVASPNTTMKVSGFNYRTHLLPGVSANNLIKGNFSLRDYSMQNNFKGILGR